MPLSRSRQAGEGMWLHVNEKPGLLPSCLIGQNGCFGSSHPGLIPGGGSKGETSSISIGRIQLFPLGSD